MFVFFLLEKNTKNELVNKTHIFLKKCPIKPLSIYRIRIYAPATAHVVVLMNT